MELGLHGRAGVITGAAGGIGRAVADALVAEGVRLALVDRDAHAVAQLAARHRDAGARAHGIAADVGDPQQVQDAFDESARVLGALDLLVVCAGVSGPVGTTLEHTAPEQWDRVMRVNATGSFLALRAAIPLLRGSDAASVVVIASDSAFVAAPGMAAYCASKAAVLQLVRAASVELRDDGIRVNAICPSVVDTPMSRGDLGLTDGFAGIGYPVQTGAEVAAQVAFLCSPRSRPVNGTGLVSDFGYSAQSGFPA